MTLLEATEMRALWLAAERAVATGQEYKIGGRELKRADLAEVHKMVLYYDGLVTSLTPGSGGGGVRLQRVMPRDV